MSRTCRGGFIFVTFVGDHAPRHVHVYRDDRLVVKWDLDNDEAMEGAAPRKVRSDRGTTRGGTAVKIQKVTADNRRRRFEVKVHRGTLPFPYVRCDPVPSPEDRLVDVYVDAELGREAFTYRLASGAEGSVHVDSVLDVNADPDYLARLELYRLTLEAKTRLGSSGLSVRQAAERLGTSSPQLYRLLDPTNYSKSARQLLAVLALGGASVKVADAEHSPRGRRGKVPA